MSAKLFWIDLSQVGDDDVESNLNQEILAEMLNKYCLPSQEAFPDAEFKVKEIEPIILNLDGKTSG